MSRAKHVLCLAALFCTTMPGHGGALTGGATEWTQIANNVQLGLQTIELVQQTRELFTQGKDIYNQLQDMYHQAERLGDVDWNDLLTYVDEIDQLLQQGQALSYAARAAESRFREYYQGYDEYLNAQFEFDSVHFDEKYRSWHTSLNDSLASTLRLHGFTHERMRDEQWRMKELESRMATADGRNALLQTSTEVAFFTSEQLRRLLSVTMQHSQTHAQYLAHERNESALQHSRKRQFYEQGELPLVDNGMNF